MKRSIGFMGRLGIVVVGLAAFTGCGKCYECSYQVSVEINDEIVETEATYIEEACTRKERNKWIDEGYTCVSL